MIERQELFCHNCSMYVQFNMDMSINGNHTLTCPNCGHKHYRVVWNGIITDDRWASLQPAIQVTGNITYRATSVYTLITSATDSTTGNYFLRDSWSSSTSVVSSW